MSMPQLKPSPVDESSLRQALQRVEDRLRQQDEKRKKNEHHERTLKLAREFAARGVQQRQRDWERQNRKNTVQQPTSQNQPSKIQTKSPLPATDSISSTQGIAIKSLKDTAKIKTPDTPNKDNETNSREKKPINAGPALKKVIPIQEVSATRQPGTEHKSVPTQTPPVPMEAIHLTLGKTPRGGLARLMPLVAWLILGAGLVGAVLSWTTISDVHANTFQMDTANFQSLPMGLLLGFAYLATGVLGFAFFWVSSLISNQLKEIRRLLFLQPMIGERSNQPRS
jgi:hypothetical protein